MELLSDMDLETEELFIFNPSLGQEFMLSIACGNSGLERVFVGANSRNEFRCHCCHAYDCQHCTTVQQWVQDQDGEAMELCEVFDSFSLRSAEQQSSIRPEHLSLPISRARIPPGFSSELLAARAFGAGASVSSCQLMRLHRSRSFQKADSEAVVCICRPHVPCSQSFQICCCLCPTCPRAPRPVYNMQLTMGKAGSCGSWMDSSYRHALWLEWLHRSQGVPQALL